MKRRSRSQRREVIYRHTFIVRLTHWVNALAIFLMIGSGLNIFNAHPALYWGQKGASSDPAVLSIGSAPGGPGGMHGLTQIGPIKLVTTHVLGWSQSHGQWISRAWPAWITLPSFQDLADARHWHFLFAWILVANGLIYLVWSLGIRHVQRDLWPTWRDLKSIPRSIFDHARLKHPTGEAAKRYNVLQRLAYLGLILLVIGMVATGLTLSPGVDAFAPRFAGPFWRAPVGADPALHLRQPDHLVHLRACGRGLPGRPNQRNPVYDHRPLCRPAGARLRWRSSPDAQRLPAA